MQLTPSFTVLSGVVALALSLTAGTHALPTVPLDSGLILVRGVGQDRTQDAVPVPDITRRATQTPSPPPPLVDVMLTSIQVRGHDIGFVAGLKLNGINVPVRVDSGSSTVWAVSASAPAEQRGHRAGYQASETRQKPWEVAYGDGSKASGQLIAMDNMEIGRLTLPNFPVGMADAMTGNFIICPDSGILGLANGNFISTRTGGPTVIDGLRIQNLIPARKVGIKLGRPTNNNPSRGRLTLGGSNPREYNAEEGNIVTVPNKSQTGLWIVSVDRMQLDTVVFAHKVEALLDTGGACILGFSQDVQQFHKLIPGGVQMNGIFALPCSTQKEISITIGGITFTMQPADLVGPEIPSVQHMCLSRVQASTRLQAGHWSLGITFLRNVYQILDSDNNMITLAKTT